MTHVVLNNVSKSYGSLVGVRPQHFVEPGAGATDVMIRVDVIESLGGTRFAFGALKSGEASLWRPATAPPFALATTFHSA